MANTSTCPVCGWVGCAVLIYLAFVFVRFIYQAFLRPAKNPSRWGAKNGAYALVTGAAGGVGKGFAQVLASKGFNLILLDRNAEQLNEVAKALAGQCRDIVSAVVDFSNPAEQWQKEVSTIVAGKDIGLLVNNVGMNTRFPADILTHTPEEVAGMLDVNVKATVAMTKLILPGMRDRRRGAIIFLSSYTGSFPCPLMSVYGASKAFIDNFACAVAEEVRSLPIDVLAVRPFYVASAMSGLRPSLTVRAAPAFARDTLRYLGFGPRAQPYWVHRVLEAFVSLLPLPLYLARCRGKMEYVRGRLIARAERKERENASLENATPVPVPTPNTTTSSMA